jgi:hypothetical protein
MTHQGHGHYTCDECPEDIATDTDDFAERREKLAAAGWRSYKGPDGMWAQSCPSCVAEFAKGKKR